MTTRVDPDRVPGRTQVPAASAPEPLHAEGDAIATTGLTKRFGRQVAVDDLSLSVPRGAVYGFLGPNGSGKTTTIRMLLGLVLPSAGSVRLLGGDMPDAAAEVLPRVGALIDGPAFHPYLSGRENLLRLEAADRSASRSGRTERIRAALERVGLGAAADKRYRAYSQGMRQRLGLAAALMRPRELLVLDEPTNGLDPQGTREVRHLVHEVAAEGTTVFVSSHLLVEVEQMCTHVGVMRRGRMVAQGTLESLRSALSVRVRVETTAPSRAAEVLGELGLGQVRSDDAGASAELGADGPGSGPGHDPDRDVEGVVVAMVRAEVPVRQVLVDRPALEELFVSLTGDGFDVDE